MKRLLSPLEAIFNHADKVRKVLKLFGGCEKGVLIERGDDYDMATIRFNDHEERAILVIAPTGEAAIIRDIILKHLKSFPG